MIYYLVIYLRDGCIMLKPYETKYDAEAGQEQASRLTKYDIVKMKIIKKDTDTTWWKSTGGYWL